MSSTREKVMRLRRLRRDGDARADCDPTTSTSTASLKLFDTAQEEMFKEAEKKGDRLPNKGEIFAHLERNGLAESSSNLYHWLEKRKEIEERYA
jgi:hypothetical protein